MTRLTRLIAAEQDFWDHVAREETTERRWIVTPKTPDQLRVLRGTGIVAGIVDDNGNAGDVDYVIRKRDGNFALVPTHHIS